MSKVQRPEILTRNPQSSLDFAVMNNSAVRCVECISLGLVETYGTEETSWPRAVSKSGLV